MRPSSAATVGLLLSLALILPGCGDERAASADRTVGPPGTAQAKAPAANSLCGSQLRGFLGSMDALRDRLAVGLNYEDYLREVRTLKGVYEKIPVDRLAIGCLAAAGSPGERALNRYLGAANTWGDCLASTSCETESLEATLRRNWALASDLLSAAQQGLRNS
jgi:hypothetical protein